MKTVVLSLGSAFILLLGGIGGVRTQTVETPKLIDSVYNDRTAQTTFFVSNMMTVAEEFGPEVYSVTDGQTKRLPSSIIKMVVYFNFSGKKRGVPDKVTLAFDSGDYRAYRFGINRDLEIQADSEKMKFGSMQLTDRRDVNDKNNLFGNVHMWETLELPIDVAQYRKIINAKSVAIRIGEVAANLNEEQLKRLKKFADQFLK